MARVDDVGATLLRAASDVLAAEGPAALTVRRIAFDSNGLPVELTDTVKAAPSYVLEYRFPAN